MQSKLDKRGFLDGVVGGKRGSDLAQAVAEGDNVVVGQGGASNFRKRADNLPVFAGSAGSTDGRTGDLRSTFGVDVGAALFGIRDTGEDDVGVVGTSVAVVPLVDNKGVLRDAVGRDFVGTKEVDEFGAGGSGGRRRADTEVKGSRPTRVLWVET